MIDYELLFNDYKEETHYVEEIFIAIGNLCNTPNKYI